MSTTKCPTCGRVTRIVNQCGCDPNNLPTKIPDAGRVGPSEQLPGTDQDTLGKPELKNPFGVPGIGYSQHPSTDPSNLLPAVALALGGLGR